jgi:predicted CoA-binding protein
LEERVDIVNIFRRSDEVLPIVQDAMLMGAPAIWMQLGVVNEEAASLAERSGIKVIMNKCIKVEYQMLIQQ